MKQKFKHPRSKRKPEALAGDVSGGESVEQASSPSRPASLIVAGGGLDRQDIGSVSDGRRVRSMDRPPAQGMSEPMPPCGGDDDREPGEAGGVDEGEEIQRCSRPHPDIEAATGGGPGREGDGTDGETVGRVDHPLSAPSTPSGGTPDGST